MASKSLFNNNKEPCKNTKSLVILAKQANVAKVGQLDVTNVGTVMKKDETELLMAKAVIPEKFPRPLVHFEEFPSVLLDACNKAKVDFKVAKRGDATTLNA